MVHRSPRLAVDGTAEELDDDLAAKLDELDLSDEIKGEVFDDEWLEQLEGEEEGVTFPDVPRHFRYLFPLFDRLVHSSSVIVQARNREKNALTRVL